MSSNTKGTREVKKLKPEILTHPNIPKPLHGMNPRSIMGQEKWDILRQEVYAKTDYTCIACGVAKQDAKKHKWLEAHEYYDINYKKGIVTIKDIYPLCHYCHNFIHSGRLSMIIGREKTEEEVIEILEHGFNILKKNKLKAFPFTVELAKNLGVDIKEVESYKIENSNVGWSKWILIYDGKEYKSKFKSYEDWQEHYK